MEQLIVLIALQLCLCVCIVGAEKKFCPAGFEKVEGIDKSRCFNYHMTKAGGIKTRVTFEDGLEICKGKNATVFEPKSREEGKTIYNFVQEKSNGSLSGMGIWIKYCDIQNQVSRVGVKDSVLLTSSYMGSLSTFNKMPIEWWNSNGRNEGGKRDKGYHCALWYSDGVNDVRCDFIRQLVCETSAEYNLKQYLKFANEDVAAV